MSEALTLTEARVARLVAEGQTNDDVSVSLAMQPKAVESHLVRVYRKLGIRSRTELALLLATAPAARSAEPGEVGAAALAALTHERIVEAVERPA